LSSIFGEWAALESIRNGKLGLGDKTPFAVLLSVADANPRSQDMAATKARFKKMLASKLLQSLVCSGIVCS
jgi:hypothetical protein